MFGEDESESPRVPSPWDQLKSSMSTPANSSPCSLPVVSSSPLAVSTIPKLVPESDDGNVEYKLQLLNPSPTRFARLVTQLKWRLLEGGGQAYYELGVADSGALVGLSRVDLEASLETLEMMAVEIGASVIVVKEIEVPIAMAQMAAAQEDYRYGKRDRRRIIAGSEGSGDGTTTATETETDFSTTDVDADFDGFVPPEHHTLRSLATKDRETSDPHVIFSMDPEPDPADNADVETEVDDAVTNVVIDLEISSVFKPRPFRTRMQPPLSSPPDTRRGHRGPKPQKSKHQSPASTVTVERNATFAQPDRKSFGKSHSRRAVRDRRREEKRKALLAVASNSLALSTTTDAQEVTNPASRQTTLTFPPETDALVSGLESLHVSVEEPALPRDEQIPLISLTSVDNDPDALDGEDDDVFAQPTPSVPYKTFQPGIKSYTEPATPLSEGTEGMFSNSQGKDGELCLIVEALVVRKMSLEEAFLDFEGFSLT